LSSKRKPGLLPGFTFVFGLNKNGLGFHFLIHCNSSDLINSKINSGGNASKKIVSAGKYLLSPINFACQVFIATAK